MKECVKVKRKGFNMNTMLFIQQLLERFKIEQIKRDRSGVYGFTQRLMAYNSNKKVFTVGETLKVLVKDIHDTKIALSLKFPETNPWANAAEKYAVGTEVTGKVARMTDFGAFVELAPGVDALLHVSQISKNHVEKPSDVLSVGQEITAKIVDLNEAEKKISLSMKALAAPEQEEAVEE